jgi:hypothetical protein
MMRISSSLTEILPQILKGKLTETRFAIPCNPGLDGPLLRTSRKNFNRDQVTYMSDSVSISLPVNQSVLY